ncbi:MAG: hypothetical protein IKL52_02620, partial [Candidatus Gastranaerophilales bacterium]|nr:hypothetical protein [Candidatus Gastranaerophilales bacterium]
PNEELPVLIWLPGSGEAGNYNAMKQRIYDDIFVNYNLETWNGYILCVNYNNSNWESQTPERLDQVIDHFSQQYSIDPERISIAGYSLGGGGVTIMATDRPQGDGSIRDSRLTDDVGYTYRNAVIATGYNYAYGDYAMPVAVFSDQGTSSSGSQLNQSTKPKLDLSSQGEDYWVDTGANHTMIDYETFNRDDNKNGRADVFEFLQGTLKDDLS